MTDSLKLAEMQRTSIEFERQRHLANWLIKSSPHMATPTTPLNANGVINGVSGSAAGCNPSKNGLSMQPGNVMSAKNGTTALADHHSGNGKIITTNPLFFLMNSNGNTGAALGNPVGGKHCGIGDGGVAEIAMAVRPSRAHPIIGAKGGPLTGSGHHVEGRKPKLRRFNSHDIGANMFSVADFENARLARRNEIEMKQRLQRRMKLGAPGVNGYPGVIGCGHLDSYGGGSTGGDCSTGDSKDSKRSNNSQTDPLPAEIFLDRYTLPRVVRISYKTKFSDETLQSSSSSNGSTAVTTSSSTRSSRGIKGLTSNSSINERNGTGTPGTGTTSSSASLNGNTNPSNMNNNNDKASNVNNDENNHHSNGNVNQLNGTHTKIIDNNATTAISDGAENQSQAHQQCGELFLMYRLVRQRQIYHGYNAKTAAANRKKGVLIPQEFPGYFSLINEKGLPTATIYTSVIQLVRERVYKFVSVENMVAFTESQTTPLVPTPANDSCIPGGYLSSVISSTPPVPPPPPPALNNRPQYVKTTARGGQVFRLLAVFEDGKQDHSNSAVSYKSNSGHGREKEKGRYAQLLNEQRQILYVSLGTKGKFYEIEPGIPQILQKLSSGVGSAEHQRKINPDCVHRITALVAPHKELPQTLRFISGPAGSAGSIPEQLTVCKISTETVVIACPIDDMETQSPIHLRKLHVSPEMQLAKCLMGFETEQRLFANPNVQNMLKFCQFNCDQFLRMVEIEVLNRSERSGSKNRGGDGLRILKPLHLPKLLRREKTAIAHEKEDSIIFLSKNDLANLEAKDQQKRHNESGSRISDKMKVFQSTKKKWFRRHDKHALCSLTSLDLDVQNKRMSIERYNDMSKLLQERFGDKCVSGINNPAGESLSDRSASEIGCSDTDTTTLHSSTIEEKLNKFKRTTKAPLQKSQSLQDVELIGNNKPDLLRSHQAATACTISEAGTDLEDTENRPPSSNATDGSSQPPLNQTSFITEKLYTEFHVKTRQYSKSSSSLHQLVHFSEPQKMQLNEHKRRTALVQVKQQQQSLGKGGNETGAGTKKLDFSIGEPVTGRRAAGAFFLLGTNGTGGNGITFNNSNALEKNTSSLILPTTPISLLEDDLPYSSVRDSLILSSDESATEQPTPGQFCQELHLIDYAKENIYAEICHDTIAVGGVPRDSWLEQANADEGDDYGDYASLTPPYMSIGPNNEHLKNSGNGEGGDNFGNGQNKALAVSRIRINCSSSPISYHTVYLDDEPLGEQYASTRKAITRETHVPRNVNAAISGLGMSDLANVTTIECVPPTPPVFYSDNASSTTDFEQNHRANNESSHHHDMITHNLPNASGNQVGQAVDNIYNTLK